MLVNTAENKYDSNSTHFGMHVFKCLDNRLISHHYLGRLSPRLARIGHVQTRRAPARAEHRHDAKVELGHALPQPQLGVEIGVETESAAAKSATQNAAMKM